MGHDTFVFGCVGEPAFQDGEMTNGHEIAYTRFGSGCPLRDVWYQTFEATEYDALLSGNGGSKTFGRVEMKVYSAHHRRFRPGRFDQLDEAMANIQKFFEQTKPEISSAVALYLKHTEFPLEVTRNIAAFAATDDAHIWMRFG